MLAAHDWLIFAGSPTQRKMVFYRGAGQSECRDDPHGEQDRNCRFDSIGGLPDNCAVGRSHARWLSSLSSRLSGLTAQIARPRRAWRIHPVVRTNGESLMSLARRAPRPWLNDEQQKLDELLDAGKTADEIATALQRTRHSIYARLQRLDVKRMRSSQRIVGRS